MLSEPQIPQPVRPVRRRARVAMTASHSAATAVCSSIPWLYFTMSMRSMSADDRTSSSVTLNPTAKSSRSRGVAIMTTWGMLL